MNIKMKKSFCCSSVTSMEIWIIYWMDWWIWATCWNYVFQFDIHISEVSLGNSFIALNVLSARWRPIHWRKLFWGKFNLVDNSRSALKPSNHCEIIHNRHIKLSLQCLGAFTKFQKAAISFTMSVHPSALNNSAPAGRIFIRSNIWLFFEKLSKNFSIKIGQE